MSKKILFVGTSSDTKTAIDHCKNMGVYTIVTDYIPYEKSKVKMLADEYWDIDVKDVDILEKKCRENNVTAVYAGNNEFCLDNTRILAKRLGLPFYATDAAWEATRNKAVFKEHCKAVGIDVPERFYLEKPFTREQLDKIIYPVIVKPFDAAASKGMRRCDNEEELIEAYDYALSFSKTKNVIVEEYVNGIELAPAFYVNDGKVEFTSNDLILYGNRKNGNNMCITIYPNNITEIFLNRYYDKVQALADRLGTKFGNFYFEIMYANDKFYFLELIHRVDGVGIWSLTEKMQGFNVIKKMVNYALGLGEPEKTKPMKDANVGGIYFYWANPGKIAKIIGRKEIEEENGIEIITDRFNEGDTIENSGSMLQMAFYVSVVAKDKEDFINKLRFVTDNLKIYDESGKELTEPTLPIETILKA